MTKKENWFERQARNTEEAYAEMPDWLKSKRSASHDAGGLRAQLADWLENKSVAIPDRSNPYPDDMFALGDDKMNGTVARILEQKGFGFITGEDKKDYFFHRSDFYGFFEDLVRDVSVGRKIQVTFEIINTEKGLRARNVRRTDDGV